MTDRPAVLIVDDDPATSRLLRDALEGDGFDVQIATEALAALDQLIRRQPALMILDLTLPVLDGAGLAAIVHRAFAATLPVILITDDPVGSERLLGIKASVWFSKPLDPVEVVAMARAMVQQS